MAEVVYPWHSFIVWLVMNNRLALKSRLFKWKLVDDTTCVLCRSSSETVNHLFFECLFSTNVWLEVLGKCRMNRGVLPWRREVSFFSRHTGSKTQLNLVRRLYFCVAVYWLWRERNLVIFQHQVPDRNRVLQKISEDVRLRIGGELHSLLYR